MSTIDPTKLAAILSAANSDAFKKALAAVDTAKANVTKAEQDLATAEAKLSGLLTPELAAILAPAPQKGSGSKKGATAKKPAGDASKVVFSKLAEVVKETPGISHKAAAKKLGIAPADVSAYLTANPEKFKTKKTEGNSNTYLTAK